MVYDLVRWLGFGDFFSGFVGLQLLLLVWFASAWFCCYGVLLFSLLGVSLGLLWCVYVGCSWRVWLLRMMFTIWQVCGVAFVLRLPTVSVFDSAGFFAGCAVYGFWFNLVRCV